jgi:uncharacterized membrane protein (UPF0182 family)
VRKKPGVLYLLACLLFVAAAIFLAIGIDTFWGAPATMAVLAILMAVLAAKYWGKTRE